MDYEIKAGSLEASFEAFGTAGGTAGGAAGRRPPLAAAGVTDPARRAFTEGFLRRGIESAPELKSLVTGTPADGGFAIPREIDALIQATLRDISPIRRIANVVSVGQSTYRKLVTTTNVASGWVAESALRPVLANDTPKFAEIAPPMGELYANPTASQAMLDDAVFDVEGWLAEEIAREFARAEGAAFVGGDGVSKPKGFLTYTVAATKDNVRAFGELQYVAAGAAGDFAAASPQDRLIDLVHALRPAYRQGATFVMNSSTLARVRKFKDSTGQFIFQPSLMLGQPATLLGFPIVEAEDMPDIAANSLSIAFGNFRAGYIVAERTDTRILRDPFTNKPFVNFYATKRVSGAVSNSEAIKLMRFSAA